MIDFLARVIEEAITAIARPNSEGNDHNDNQSKLRKLHTLFV